MYTLYGGEISRALMVEMVFAEGDIPYELIVVDILKGEHRAPEFLKINPAGWVPALVTPEGEILSETAAINLYLAERHNLTQLVPGVEEAERGMFLSGFFYLTNDLEPILKRYFYPHRFITRKEDMSIVKQQALDSAFERLSVIENRLAEGGPFHLGERFSLVDLTMCYWTSYINADGLFDSYPRIRQCMELVKSRPKLQPKFEALERIRVKYAKMQARGAN